jgi:pimeloyl-ACP methyl ester carboxylesterase
MKTASISCLTTASGLALEYDRRGDRSSTPVILLHGYTDSCRSFGPLLDHLSGDLHAIALTQRGHGGSERPNGTYSLSAMAYDVAEFLDELGFERAVVVGHCMGGLVAQRFAIDYPARAAGLVVINGFATLQGIEAVDELWNGAVAHLVDPVDPVFVRGFQEGSIAARVPSAFMDLVVAESLRLPADLWRRILSDLRRENHTRELGAVTAPTRLFWGDRDAAFPWHLQEELLGAIRHADHVVIRGAGHSPHWERPALMARAICEFAAPLLATRAPSDGAADFITNRSTLETGT